MGKGISLHIGLNSVDPQRYEGWSGPLNACEADANDMADLGSSRELLVHQAAHQRSDTGGAVLNGIGDAAKNLKSGDIFFLTYSGHGGQAPDLNNEEPDGMDETWCLYDGQLIDDELYSSWGAFASGVRIFLLSDSCHSGTVSKAIHYREKLRSGLPPVYRAMPDEVALRVYQNNKSFYDPILKIRNLSEALSAVKASVLLISGCQDNQLSDRRHLQRSVHRHVENGLEWRNIRRIVPALSHGHRIENAARPDAEAVIGGSEQSGVHRAKAIDARRPQEGPGVKPGRSPQASPLCDESICISTTSSPSSPRQREV